MRATPGLSFAKYANRLSWKPNDSDSRVKNTMATLARRGFVTKKEDERYYLIEAGETAAAAAATCPKLGNTQTAKAA
jgi:Mn-dependent DtxR family transcriptional regulator